MGKKPKINLFVVFSFLVCVSACKTNEVNPDQAQQNSQTKDFFGGLPIGARQEITLREGRRVNVPKYTIESSVVAALQQNPYNEFLKKLKNTPRWARLLSAANMSGLSEIEIAAIDAYSSFSYDAFRQYFNGEELKYVGDRLNDNQVEPLFLATISAINKLPKYKSSVYFGACLDLKTFLPLLKPGKFFSQRNFTSTSLNQEVAFGFSSCTPGNIEMGSMMFTIENSHSGSDVSEFSAIRAEKEILFLPGQPFRVKSFKEVPKGEPSETTKYEVLLVDES